MTRLVRKNLRYCGFVGLVVVCCALLAVAPVAAHKEATGIVKERMELMSALGKAMKTLKAMARASKPIDVAVLTSSAEAIRHHNAQLPALFPTGSYAMPSEALPIIEERRKDFEVLFDRLGEKAAQLAVLAEAPDPAALAEWLRQTGRICSTCHKTFRGAH